MKQKTLCGKISIHSRGFGFVTLQRDKQDVFIPKPFTLNAVDGDFVQIEVLAKQKKDKGPEGKVVKILKRAHSCIVGIVTSKKTGAAYSSTLPEKKPIKIISSPKNLDNGERVYLKVLSWGKKNGPVECKVIKKLGSIKEAAKDIDIAILEYGIKNTFPKSAMQEATLFGTRVRKKDLEDRRDFTNETCFTIDPTTAKDFDDALAIKQTNFGYQLNVHIADVSHYVRPNSSLDLEAKKRLNSTYFPTYCAPMLPPQLSNNLCSLKEGVIRLTVSVMMQFNKKGELKKYHLTKGYIKSKKRFTYAQALDIIEGRKKSVHKQALLNMAALCKQLRKIRFERGSIDLSLPETILKIDEQGNPIALHVEPYHIAHQLVEEFMLKTNEVIAHHFLATAKPSLFRVHEEPEQQSLTDFYHTVRALGFPLSANPSHEEVQNIFSKAKPSASYHQVAVAFIRSMKIAMYSEKNVGHYGLALDHYVHFTSPIRRYSDLVVHRCLFDQNANSASLSEIAKLCSQQERISWKAENSVLMLKKLRYLQRMQNPETLFKAQISKTAPIGITIEILPLQIEGFIHISALGRDYFHFYPKTSVIEGERTHRRFCLGQTVQVRLVELDLIHQKTFWKLVL